MRLAILADIHGNLPAFEAALEHARQHADRIVLAGDVVSGAPDSAECWRLAQSLNCPIVRGNHERYVAFFGTPDAPPIWSTDQFGPVRWAATQLSDHERQQIAALPLLLRLEDAPDLLIVHSSLVSDRDTIAAYTAESELDALFPNVSERYIVRGHNHIPQVRLWGEKLVITTGSVGLPLDGNPTAQYVLLEQTTHGWHIQHQSVPYDLEAVLRRFRESGYLEAAGPMARLIMREVATAAPYMVPFLRVYEQWQAQEAITLADAVERFFTYI